jgi:uncharacterized protein (DUF58 family)
VRQPNFARLNHVLIPATKEGRDRLRGGWFGRVAWPLAALYASLTEEGRMVALLTAVVGGFGIDVRNTELYVLWAMLTALLVASIVVRPLYSLRGDVEVEVNVSRRVLLGAELVFTVTLHNVAERDLHAVRVTGPFLPWDGRWTSRRPGVGRLKKGERAEVELRARFVSRGEHHLDSFHATALVPLGLAKGRGVETGGARFLVLPRIARVVRLTLPETRRTEPGGVALASKTGDSMELLGVRPYRPGDPIRLLHARSWGRTGQPIVREFQEEFFRRLAVVVDVDANDERSAEAAISLAAGVVAHLARARGEALVDLLVAGERIHDLTLGRSLGFLEQALELLACFVPQESSHTHAAEVLARLEPHVGRLSGVVVVDAGDRSGAVVEQLRRRGVGCAWLRVERGARGGVDRQGAWLVDPEAIERGEELAL